MPTNILHLPRLALSSVTQMYGLTARALRFYEERDLIHAHRDRLNCRYYDDEARRRLDWIVPLRRAGIAVRDIRDMLDTDELQGGARDLALRLLTQREEQLEAQLAATRQAKQAFGEIASEGSRVRRPPGPVRATV